jgi:hypothetical protein
MIKIQLPRTFIADVQNLLDSINKKTLKTDCRQLVERIQSVIDEKHEAEKRRKLYQTVKTAKTDEDREIARDMYFDSRRISRDFRDPKAFEDKDG